MRAAGQQLPPLPPQFEIADDEREDRGPLQGIATGLARLADRAEVVFVSAVDAPLLHPAVIRHVLRELRARDDVALPRAHGFAQPLAAAYRTAIAEALERQIESGRLDTGSLLAHLRVHELDEAALLADPDIAEHDPELTSLLSLNDRSEYEAARARPAPRVIVRLPGHAARPVEAATLQAAATAAGMALGPDVVAQLDGYGIVADPATPLASGDGLAFVTSATTP